MKKKSIVFVNPPYTVWDERVRLPRALENTMPSLGLLGLAAVVREAGWEPHVVEAGALGLSLGETARLVVSKDPAVLAVRASTVSVVNGARLAAMVKEAAPHVTVVLGGPHVSAVPAETMERLPVFDFGVVGEGELTLVELLSVLDGGGDPAGIRGLVFVKGGETVVTGRRPYIEDLDGLPMPAWDLLDGFPGAYRPPLLSYRALPAASLVTSRGCPYGCTFCDRSVFGRRYRGFGAAYVASMAERLVTAYGVRHILFYDDLFSVSKDRLVEVCRRLRPLAEGHGLTWSCDARVESVTAGTLAQMKAAGCWEIAYGVESGSQEILDRVAKGTRLEEVERAVRLTHEAGIKVKGLFMMGHPGETPRTIRMTVELARRLPFDHINISRFTPYPGTAVYREASRWGEFREDWERMNAMTAVFVPRGFTEASLTRAYRRAILDFYVRPSVLWRLAKDLVRNPDTARRLLAAQGELIGSLVRMPFHGLREGGRKGPPAA